MPFFLFFPLPLWVGILLQMPMIADGWSQLKGWRNSINKLRTVTGLGSGVGLAVGITSLFWLIAGWMNSIKEKEGEIHLFATKKKNLKEEQHEILGWLSNHRVYKTPHGVWEMLFLERKARKPDKCIAMYDNLNQEEKIGVELLFSLYFYFQLMGTGKKYLDKRLTLEECYECIYTDYFIKKKLK